MRFSQGLSFTVRWLHEMASENNSELVLRACLHEAIVFTRNVCMNLKSSSLI